MAGLFARAKSGKSVFADERVFYPEHLPARLPHRDAELEDIAAALEPLLRGGRARAVFVHGGPGTGKTASVRHVARELEEATTRARCLYVNCFEHGTRHSVLARLAVFLGAPVPRRGVATDEVLEEVAGQLARADFAPVLVLDEVDQLLREGEGSRLLYDLLRMEGGRNRVALVLISNDETSLARLDGRVKSSLQPRAVPFAPYTPPQLKDILRARCAAGFAPGVVEEEVINVAAAHAAKNGGDARIAIQAVWNAGRLAEREGADRVTLAHLRAALEGVSSRAVEKTAPHLDAHEKRLLALLQEGERFAGDLYAAYRKGFSHPLSERALRKKIARLQAAGLVKARPASKGSRGRTRLLLLAVPAEDIARLLQTESRP